MPGINSSVSLLLIGLVSSLFLFSCGHSAESEVVGSSEIVGQWRYVRLILPDELEGLEYAGTSKPKVEFSVSQRLLEMENLREDLETFTRSMNRYLEQINFPKVAGGHSYKVLREPRENSNVAAISLWDLLLKGSQDAEFELGFYVARSGTEARKGKYDLVFNEVDIRSRYANNPAFQGHPEAFETLNEAIKSIHLVCQLVASDQFVQEYRPPPPVSGANDVKRQPDGPVHIFRDPYTMYDMLGKRHWAGSGTTLHKEYNDGLSSLVQMENEMKSLLLRFSADGYYRFELSGEPNSSLQWGSYSVTTDDIVYRWEMAPDSSVVSTCQDRIKFISKDSFIVGSDQIHVLYVRAQSDKRPTPKGH